jgi:hypothetical protein
LTRSSTRKFKTQEEPPTTNHPTEKKDDGGQHTFNRLRKKSREAKDMIIQQREENKKTKLKCKEPLNECDPTMDHAIFMVKRNLPLYKHLKNIYKQHMTLRKENRSLKQILQHLEIENKGKDKLDLLVEAKKL